MIKVKFKRLHLNAVIPTKKSEGAAAYDLVWPGYISCRGREHAATFEPGDTLVLDMGFSLEIPKGWKADIKIRSSLAKKGLILTNAPGLIDSDYRGEIKCIITSVRGNYFEHIKAGERIAQMEIRPVYEANFVEVDELSETERGSGGLGSTGK